MQAGGTFFVSLLCLARGQYFVAGVRVGTCQPQLLGVVACEFPVGSMMM